jgi:CTP synthase
LGDYVIEHLNLQAAKPDLDDWRKMIRRMRSAQEVVHIGVVGKYIELHDAYMSVKEALFHAASAHDRRLEIHWIYSGDLEKDKGWDELERMDGIVVPGGFGYRGVEGKILAAQFSRLRKVPYLGLCLGMQVMSIEFARNVLELEDANSAEFETGTEHPVIDLMLEQRHITDMGGTMRLGLYPCKLIPGSVAARAYGGAPEVEERHRHRFELNNTYRTLYEQNGMRCTGISPDGQLVEIAEIEGHPFMVGSQFHPEFLSRPNRPHPLFLAFLEAAIAHGRGLVADTSEVHPNGYNAEEIRDETELRR